MLFWYPVLPDIVRKNITDFGMLLCQIKNVRGEMVAMTMADQYQKIFVWKKGRQGTFYIIKQQI